MSSSLTPPLPSHLALVRCPPGVQPDVTVDEPTAVAALEHAKSLDAIFSQIAQAGWAGGVALFLAPALPLCVAYLVAREGRSLAEAIALVSEQAAAQAEARAAVERHAWLTQPDLHRLLQLEMRVRGEPSDLSTVPGCPNRWLWVHWSDGGNGSTLVGRGRAIRVERLRPDPRMARVCNFFSADEAEHIIELARASLHPSRVVDYAATAGKGTLSDARTSRSCKVGSLSDVVVQRAVQRAAYLTGLTPQHAEAVQMVHYTPGQEYRPHFDWFSPSDLRFKDKTRESGNRLVSFFIYLSACDAGGHTGFPRLGQSFPPEAGSGLVWYNLDRNGVPDERTLHAGCPVEKGDKWGLNIWLRERPRYVPPARARLGLSLCSAGALPPSNSAVGAASSVSQSPRVCVCVSVRRATSTAPAPCASCGDAETPLGLCLCQARYRPALPAARAPAV